MKKFLSLFLALALIFVLCACGGQSGDGETPVTPDEPVEEVVNLKFGLVCLHDENSTYDLNFINAFKEVCEKNGIDYLIKTGVGENSECYDAAAELADSGCTVVFADSFGHEDYMLQAALEFPDVQFCHATGTKAHIEKVSNFHNAFASIYEGRYLAGVAAGLKLKEITDADGREPVVGYVGAYSYAEVISGYNAFFLGVKSIVPEATMKVIFTGSWFDETAEKEAANRLIDAGAVVISAHADSMGMPNACQTAGVPFVAYNGSFKAPCPDTYIISTRINWGPYVQYLIDCMKAGKSIDADWTGTIATGSVEMCELNEAVAAPGTKEALDSIIAEFNAGTKHVFDISTFTLDGEKVTTYMADVDTDDAYTPDTEAIANGYFHESEYRSAPYFDLNVDGITLLNTAF